MADNDTSLGDMLQSAMSDPRFGEILKGLKQKSDRGELDISSVLSELTDDKPNGEQEKNEENHSRSSGLPIGDFKKHRQLIAALRPYLSDGKKNAVDSILKIGDMSSAFEAVMKMSKNSEK